MSAPTIKFLAIALAGVLLGGCDREQDNARLQQAEQPTVAPPLPAAPDPGWTTAAPQEWSEGAWTYDREKKATQFGEAGSEPLFSMQCVGDDLRFIRTGAPAPDPPPTTHIRLLTSAGALTVPAIVSDKALPTVWGDIELRTAQAEQLVDERSAYVVEVVGLPTLKMPAQPPMMERLIADCLEPSDEPPSR